MTTVTVKTASCSGCSSGNVEQGLKLYLDGQYGTECNTNSLDNSNTQDYGSNHVAMFNSTVLGGNDDHGLGGCNNVSIMYIFTYFKYQNDQFIQFTDGFEPES